VAPRLASRKRFYVRLVFSRGLLPLKLFLFAIYDELVFFFSLFFFQS